MALASQADPYATRELSVQLGFYMGYAPPGTSPLEPIALAQEAERLGYDSAWAAEAWGTDCVTVLSWLGATTERIKLGSAIMQIPGRTPANTAMTAATLDLLSGGRFLLGLGTSGPQVVEGWHGEPWGKPLDEDARVRRDRAHGAPARARRAPRRALRHPGLERNRARQAAQADGAAAPRGHPDLPRGDGPEGGRAGVRDRRRLAADLLVAGERRATRSATSIANARQGFDIAATAPAILIDDVEAGREFLKPYYALYIGGMGARGKNFYNDLACRYGYEEAAREIQDLYLDGHKRDAAAAVPDAFVDEVALVGPKERLAERLDAWRESGATSLLVSTQQPEALRALAEIALVTTLLRRARSPPPRRFGEERHAFLEARSALVLGAELPAQEPSVDRLAEDRRLPERERLEPAERLDVAAASGHVALDQLRPRREALREP